MFIYLNGQPANLPYNNQYTQRTGSDEDLFHAVKFAEEEMCLLQAADEVEQEKSDEDLATAVACMEEDIGLVEATETAEKELTTSSHEVNDDVDDDEPCFELCSSMMPAAWLLWYL